MRRPIWPPGALLLLLLTLLVAAADAFFLLPPSHSHPRPRHRPLRHASGSTLEAGHPSSPAAGIEERENVEGAAVGTGVNVFYSERLLEHKVKGYHPENGFRVSIPARALAEVEGVRMKEPGVSPEEALKAVERVHSPEYVAEIRALSQRGGGFIDHDTYANYATYDACLLASAAWIDAARHTLLGDDSTTTPNKPHRRPSFALTRPPGHHATRSQAGGFCIFNHCIVAATYALEELRCKRVAILDWDAHHGNGNEALARDDPRIAYASLHQQDAFPLTGLDPEDHGPLGNILDVPIPAYTDVRAYLPLLEEKVIPFLKGFDPDLLIVSAGYDCLADDPLAQLALGPSDFTAIAERLKAAFGADKIMFGLEGGYEPELITEAVKATLAPFLPTAGGNGGGGGGDGAAAAAM